MVIWLIFWTAASPLALLAGASSLGLVLFNRTRAAGRIVGVVAVVAGTGATLLFASAYEGARSSQAREADVLRPAERATWALRNAEGAFSGAVLGLAAIVLAARLAQRTS